LAVHSRLGTESTGLTIEGTELVLEVVQIQS